MKKNSNNEKPKILRLLFSRKNILSYWDRKKEFKVKKVLKMVIKMMMLIVTVYAIKVAVVDMWECGLAVDMWDSAKRMMMVL